MKNKQPENKGNTWREQDDAFFGPPPVHRNRTTSTTGNNVANSSQKQEVSRPSSSFNFRTNNSNNDRNNSNLHDDDSNHGNHISKNIQRNSLQTITRKISSVLENNTDRIKSISDQSKNNLTNWWNKNHNNYREGNSNTTQSNEYTHSTRHQPHSTCHPSNFKDHGSSFDTKAPSNNFKNRVHNILQSQIPYKCVYCNSIPLTTYKHHPFYGPKYRVCSFHDWDTIPRCKACNRFQSNHLQLTDIYSSYGADSLVHQPFLLCSECHSTSITNTNQATSIYFDVLQFLSSQLSVIWDEMFTIPIHLIDELSLHKLSSSTSGMNDDSFTSTMSIRNIFEQNSIDKTIQQHVQNKKNPKIPSSFQHHQSQESSTSSSEKKMKQQINLLKYNPNEIKERGLCIWQESFLMFGSLPLRNNKLVNFLQQQFSSFKIRNQHHDDRTINKVSFKNENQKYHSNNVLKGSPDVSVKAILCLEGLPYYLTGSILAHEATHAWFALNPSRSNGNSTTNGLQRSSNNLNIRRINQQVEEGCCQLSSYLYLTNQLLGPKYETAQMGKTCCNNNLASSTTTTTISKEQSLVMKYFIWEIESNKDVIYGDGFRLALKAYNQVQSQGGNLGDLFNYVSIHLNFPP